MRKSSLQGFVLAAVTACLSLLGMELALRIHRGQLFQFESSTNEPPSRAGRLKYDSRLGWAPNPGRFVTGWTSTVDASGLRSNGTPISTTQHPILVVGDSFTFGDEVEDGETWAAYLQAILNQPVLNAGVSAYGIDQAVLRAERLLNVYHPDVVLLSFISDDINRTEYSYYPYGRGWKPYFELTNGSLQLRNFPVPEKPAPRRFQGLRRLLGYSQLADFVLGRIADRWWQGLPRIQRIHRDGENVSAALLKKLDSLTRTRGARLVAIALGTNGRIRDDSGLRGLIESAGRNGVQVLDLANEMLKLAPDSLQSRFRPGGHYSPGVNRWIAGRIGAFLEEQGMARRPD